MGVTDSVMIGRIGKVPLAASAFASSIFNFVYITGLGLLLAVSINVARAHGARQSRECAEFLRHGMAMGLVLGVGAAALLFGVATQLHRFGQPPEVLGEVNPFFVIIAASLVPVFVFQVLKQYSEALGHPWAPMVILLGAVGLNVFLNWVLIYGRLGAPALGLAGSGWATFIARTVAALGMWWWLSRQAGVKAEWPAYAGAMAGEPGAAAPPGPSGPEAGPGANPRWLAAFSKDRFAAMLHLGVPAASQWLFEVGAFSAAAIMMGWLGTTALAAHQIALSCASFTFMFPLGLSTATSMRLSKALGEGRRDALRAVGFGSLGAGFVLMAVFAAGFAGFGHHIAAGFTPDPGVVAVAAQLLVVAAFFQLFDGAQVIGAAALRGLHDVKIPTVLTFVAYWLVALPAGYLLAFHTALGPVGIWVGLAAGLGSAALLLGWRFHRLTG
ncbi:MAG: MATE family efflux transporter [Opitutae bacterium]|nr:MATE family efflux transporter [Opitutae bacterium]